MKIFIRMFLSILMLIQLTSCNQHYTNNIIILRAENILFSKPDSAYRLLKSIPNPETLSLADRAAWCLHYTHAEYKTTQTIKSDSLLRIAVGYYKDGKLNKYSGTAYYLWGCYYIKHQQYKEALIALKKADELLESTNEFNLKGLVEFNIGYTCRFDGLNASSLDYFRKSSDDFKNSGNHKYQAYAYRDIAEMYYQLDRPFDSVLLYSNEALKLSKEVGDSANYHTILGRLGELLYKKDYSQSKQYLLKAYRFFPSKQGYYSAVLSYIYSKTNKPDSANYYLQVALTDTAKSYSKLGALLAGAYVNKDCKNLKQAFDYLEQAFIEQDSIYSRRFRTQLYRIDKQYDRTLTEQENTHLKISNRNNTILIFILVTIVLAITIILLLILASNKKKQANQLLENQRIEFELKEKRRNNDQKRELLLIKLKDKVENTLRFNRLKLGISQQDKQEAFWEELSGQVILSEKEWQYYIDEVDRIFDKKITNLFATYSRLTQADLIVISLILLKLDISDCCSLLNMSKNTMYHRRKIIKDRVGLSKEDDLEEWVQNYVQIQN
jgi:tetratricopeptide (TPR) repeat protein